MSATHSVTDSPAVLTQSDILFIRQQAQAATQQSHSGTAPERGRGPTRIPHHSTSSRAASAASSRSVSGRILLDDNSLTSLGVHLDIIMSSINGRINEVGVLTTICLLLLTMFSSLADRCNRTVHRENSQSDQSYHVPGRCRVGAVQDTPSPDETTGK